VSQFKESKDDDESKVPIQKYLMK